MPSIRRAFFIAAMVVAGAAFSADQRSPQIAVVSDLYRAFAYEAVMEDPDPPGFIDQPRNVLLRYLTPELSDLILQDRACAASTHEICRLDFLPLWGSQDPIGAAVQLKPGAPKGSVIAHVRYGDTVAQIAYSLTKTSTGWRIDDVSYGKGRPTLKELLKAKL